jgi:hypothetical protein
MWLLVLLTLFVFATQINFVFATEIYSNLSGSPLWIRIYAPEEVYIGNTYTIDAGVNVRGGSNCMDCVVELELQEDGTIIPPDSSNQRNPDGNWSSNWTLVRDEVALHRYVVTVRYSSESLFFDYSAAYTFFINITDPNAPEYPPPEGPACYEDSDCGFTTRNYYCDGYFLVTETTNWFCGDPGTNDSYCYSEITSSSITCEFGCENGACLPEFLGDPINQTGDPEPSPQDDDDGDGVADTGDACPNTPEGSVIVITNDPSFQGCTCEQIDALINNNPCIDYTCAGNQFNIDYRSTSRNVCPVDYCESNNLYNYRSNPLCFNNIEQSCTYEVIENYEDCIDDGVINEPVSDPVDVVDYPTMGELGESVLYSVPPLEGIPGVRHVTVTGGDFYFWRPQGVELDEEFKVISTMVLSEDPIYDFDTTFNTTAWLYLNGETVYGTSFNGETVNAVTGETDENSVLFYTQQWVFPAGDVGSNDFRISFQYQMVDEDPTIYEEDFVVEVVTEEPLSERELEEGAEGVIGRRLEFVDGTYVRRLTPLEKEIIAEIFRKMVEKGLRDEVDLEEEFRKIEEANNNADIRKERVVGNGKTSYNILVNPTMGVTLRDVTIFEVIPKEIAQNIDEINFNIQPIIIEDDPLIMWHFEEISERVDLSYDVDREVQVNGNTVLTAEEVVRGTPLWRGLIPLLLIPIIIVGYVYFSKYARRGSKD